MEVSSLHNISGPRGSPMASVKGYSHDTERTSGQETIKRSEAYKALWLHNEEVTQERDQLRADLATLQSQVAYLMAERNERHMGRKTSAARESRATGGGELSDELWPRQQRLDHLTGTPTAKARSRPSEPVPRQQLAPLASCLGGPRERSSGQTMASVELGPGCSRGPNRLVSLVEEDALEIHDMERFLVALHHRFEDSLAEEKAQTALQ
uniref:Uncharacterized protein n=1 Tax=Sphaerodactylus townsendi TaxID=933632 RepID=A0ACB8GD25_9SAUR